MLSASSPFPETFWICALHPRLQITPLQLRALSGAAQISGRSCLVLRGVRSDVGQTLQG